MKERSVEFYKKLIVFSGIVFLIVIGLLAGFLIERVLDSRQEREQNEPINKPVVAQSETQKPEEEPKKNTEPSGSETGSKSGSEASIETSSGKIIYLSFDDGASPHTDEILDILKEKGIKATFFFNTSPRRAGDRIIKRAFEEGHSLGVLTSKNAGYTEIYKSPEVYGMDLDMSLERISDLTGERPKIMRFPGGSRNGFNKNNYEEYIEQIELRQLTYFDWDICADHRGSGVESLVYNGTRVPAGYDEHILLMHDHGKYGTCDALRRIIDFYEAQGYSFGKLTEDVRPIVF